MEYSKREYLLKKLNIKRSIEEKKAKIELLRYLRSSAYKKTVYFRIAFFIFFFSIFIFNRIFLIPRTEVVKGTDFYISSKRRIGRYSGVSEKQFFVLTTDNGRYITTEDTVYHLKKGTLVTIERNCYSKPARFSFPNINKKYLIPQNVQFFYVVSILMVLTFGLTNTLDLETNKIFIYISLVAGLGSIIYYLFFN